VLKYRLITGPLLVVVLFGVILFDAYLDSITMPSWWADLFTFKQHPEKLPSGLALFGVSLLLVTLSALELSRIFSGSGIANRPWLTALAAVTGLVLSYSVPMRLQAVDAIALVATGAILLMVISLLTFARTHNVETVVAATGAVVFALVYLGLMLGFLLALRRDHSAWWIVGVIVVTKACDTCAYFSGRAFGRHKMIPWLSPGKTWEGLAGGVLGSVVMGLVMAGASRWLANPADHVPYAVGAIAGVLFSLVGQGGDLTMSLFKRGAGLKDASSILPGMGGVLDVLDSPLMVAPVAYWLLTSLPATPT
jgi:phosphatidate cytidylyltransferase